MVDRTVYPGKVPELSLRQIFGRQKLDKDLCIVAAECGLLSIEMFAMLGDTIQGVKTTLQTLIPDHDKLGADDSAKALALTALAAVWKMCSTLQEQFASRRAKMEEDPSKIPEIPGDDHAEFREQFVSAHPDVVLPPHREPHRKFVERLQRDFLVHGSVPFYEVGEIRTRTEQIVQKAGLSKNSEDLLKVVTVDQPVAAASESQVIDKLYAFFIALEYLNICEFTVKDGPLKYLSELEEWRHENRGLALLLSVDSLIRKKVHRLNSDHRKSYPTFKSALLEVLANHKQLWNDARSGAELDKFKQAGHSDGHVTPDRGTKRQLPDDAPSPSKARKNKARRERQKKVVAQARAQLQNVEKQQDRKGDKVSRDARVPAKEWSAITAFKYNGPRRCPFFNCSLGCRFGDQCKNKHVCVECGQPHSWHGNH